MIRRLRNDDGIAVIIAMFVLLIVLGMGLAMVALADNQQAPARDERKRAASTTLAEAALTAQVFQLSRLPWPAAAVGAPAADCTSLAATPDSCPDVATIANTFKPAASADYASGCTGPLWQTWVRDNGPLNPTNSPYRQYYSTAGVYSDATIPAWDANGDGKLWVGAAGVVKLASGCTYRRFVTLVAANQTQINVPHNIITANWLTIAGKKKAVVDTTGQHAQPKSIRPPKKQAASQAAPVRVRCNAPLPGGVVSPCYPAPPPLGTAPKDQIKPNTAKNDNTVPAQMFTAAQLAGFQQQALAAGKYYPTGTPCASMSLTGKIVVIEDVTGCSFSAGGNDKNNPGFLVIKKGLLTLTGKATFYGLIYHANLPSPGVNTKLVYVTGSAVVQGAVSVDGPGGVNTDSKHTAFIYDPRVFALAMMRTNAIAVPGTWRELGPTE